MYRIKNVLTNVGIHIRTYRVFYSINSRQFLFEFETLVLTRYRKIMLYKAIIVL